VNEVPRSSNELVPIFDIAVVPVWNRSSWTAGEKYVSCFPKALNASLARARGFWAIPNASNVSWCVGDWGGGMVLKGSPLNDLWSCSSTSIFIFLFGFGCETFEVKGLPANFVPKTSILSNDFVRMLPRDCPTTGLLFVGKSRPIGFARAAVTGALLVRESAFHFSRNFQAASPPPVIREPRNDLDPSTVGVTSPCRSVDFFLEADGLSDFFVRSKLLSRGLSVSDFFVLSTLLSRTLFVSDFLELLS
jgi:hypothetical protein